jgi:DNA-binding IclR family transcriptional regulator
MAGDKQGSATVADKGASLPSYQAPALDKGLDILEFLSSQSEAYTLSDLAKALDRSKNEIYRMALVLERRGYLERTPDDRFLVTNRLFQLGMLNPPLRNLHDAAMPIMHELAETLGQSCHLAVASGDEIVAVARVESPGLLGFAVRVGYRRHVVEATSGQVLFGFQPEARRTLWLKSLKASAPGRADVAKFLKQADEARAKGYALAESSFVLGVTDIAAPVYDGVEAGPAGSLTLPFLARLDRTGDAAAAAEIVRSRAESITERLRHG